MNLIKRLASEVKKNHWWSRQTRVVIGVSTGVDSMVLLYLLEHLRYCRPRITVAHVNHELRSASQTEEKYIRNYCARHHLDLAVAHWLKKDHPRTGTENAARQFRYRFFKRVMDSRHASVLLTAHHLNDQAETILMRLIRGGDLHELTGIHRCRRFAKGYLIRPLLKTPKRYLRSFAIDHHIKWYEDRTNYSLKITRNRMRHRLLPWMAQEDSRVLTHIGDYVDQLTALIRDNLALNARLIQPLGTARRNWWNLKPLFRYSSVIQWGILHELFYKFDSKLIIPPRMMNEIIKLLNDARRPQGRISISNQLQFRKNYYQFGIVTNSAKERLPLKTTFQVRLNQWYRSLNGLKFGVFNKKVNSPINKCFKFNLQSLDFPLKIRLSRPSDRIRLKNGGHQKVRRIWIDQKVSNKDRSLSQILMTRKGVNLALLGFKASFIKEQTKAKSDWLVVKRLQKRG